MTRRSVLWGVVLLGGLVRLGHLLAVYPTPMFAAHRIWPASDMYTFDQWARQITAGDVLGRTPYYRVMEWMSRAATPEQWGRWFGDAPVFYTAPLYPYLVALVGWPFADPALPMALLQIAASLASIVLLFLVTERLFGSGAALAAAAVLAVYGPAVHYDAVLLRGPWVVLASLLLTWLLLRVRERFTAAGAGIVGLVVGISILLNESFAMLALLVPLVLVWWAPGVSRAAVSLGAFVVGLGVSLAPLVARNVALGVPPLQVARQGALVFAFFNASDADPLIFGNAPASLPGLMEAAEGRLGRIAWLCLHSFDGVAEMVSFYLRRAAGLIAPFENTDNASFYYATLQSPLLRWLPDYAWLFPVLIVGIVLALRHPRRGLLVALLPVSLALLAANLVAPPLSRYRLPLIVLWMPCAGLALDRLWGWVRQGRITAVAATIGAMVGAAMFAHQIERRVVLGGEDAWRHVYRMADFVVVAREYERQGRYAEAGREYLTFAAHVPHGSRQWAQARYLAAPLQVRAGDAAGGRASADAAAERAPADAGVLVAIGDLYWQTFGDPEAAARLYRRAAALEPTGPTAHVLQDRLRRVDALAAPR